MDTSTHLQMCKMCRLPPSREFHRTGRCTAFSARAPYFDSIRQFSTRFDFFPHFVENCRMDRPYTMQPRLTQLQHQELCKCILWCIQYSDASCVVVQHFTVTLIFLHPSSPFDILRHRSTSFGIARHYSTPFGTFPHAVECCRIIANPSHPVAPCITTPLTVV